MTEAPRQSMPISYPMEIKKTLMYVSGMMLATGGPITMYSASDYVGGAKQDAQAVAATAPSGVAAPAPSGAGVASQRTSPPGASALRPSNAPTPITGLAEILRFDVTVEWILQRWPRVTTGLSYLQLQGYRVPIVTGTQLTDVAGSLTYYFNAGQQAQRITFRGTTGDPSVLVTLLTSRFQFTRRLTNDPGWVVYETANLNNRPAGTLKIRSARIINASQPYTRFEVEFEMDRPE